MNLFVQLQHSPSMSFLEATVAPPVFSYALPGGHLHSASQTKTYGIHMALYSYSTRGQNIVPLPSQYLYYFLVADILKELTEEDVCFWSTGLSIDSLQKPVRFLFSVYFCITGKAPVEAVVAIPVSHSQLQQYEVDACNYINQWGPPMYRANINEGEPICWFIPILDGR